MHNFSLKNKTRTGSAYLVNEIDMSQFLKFSKPQTSGSINNVKL